MTGLPQHEPQSVVTLRNITHVAYGLFALGFLTAGFFGVATVAGVILLYIKRGDAAGTVYASHFDWLMQTFWWGLLWLAISALATLVFIGWIGVVATFIWAIYRVIKGWIALLEHRSPTGV